MAKAWVVDDYVDDQDGTLISRLWFPVHSVPYPYAELGWVEEEGVGRELRDDQV